MFEAAHAKRYAERMTAYLGLDMQSHVIEVASNDGHLLQHFSKLGIPVIGIEPDHASAARAMKARGIPTLTGSFGRDMAQQLAAEGIDADLMVANNALFRVPDADDFLSGFALLLNPTNPNAGIVSKDLQAAAQTLGLQIRVLNARTEHEIDSAFATLAQHTVGALIVGPDAFFDSRAIKL